MIAHSKARVVNSADELTEHEKTLFGEQAEHVTHYVAPEGADPNAGVPFGQPLVSWWAPRSDPSKDSGAVPDENAAAGRILPAHLYGRAADDELVRYRVCSLSTPTEKGGYALTGTLYHDYRALDKATAKFKKLVYDVAAATRELRDDPEKCAELNDYTVAFFDSLPTSKYADAHVVYKNLSPLRFVRYGEKGGDVLRNETPLAYVGGPSPLGRKTAKVVNGVSMWSVNPALVYVLGDSELGRAQLLSVLLHEVAHVQGRDLSVMAQIRAKIKQVESVANELDTNPQVLDSHAAVLDPFVIPRVYESGAGGAVPAHVALDNDTRRAYLSPPVHEMHKTLRHAMDPDAEKEVVAQILAYYDRVVRPQENVRLDIFRNLQILALWEGQDVAHDRGFLRQHTLFCALMHDDMEAYRRVAVYAGMQRTSSGPSLPKFFPPLLGQGVWDLHTGLQKDPAGDTCMSPVVADFILPRLLNGATGNGVARLLGACWTHAPASTPDRPIFTVVPYDGGSVFCRADESYTDSEMLAAYLTPSANECIKGTATGIIADRAVPWVYGDLFNVFLNRVFHPEGANVVAFPWLSINYRCVKAGDLWSLAPIGRNPSMILPVPDAEVTDQVLTDLLAQAAVSKVADAIREAPSDDKAQAEAAIRDGAAPSLTPDPMVRGLSRGTSRVGPAIRDVELNKALDHVDKLDLVAAVAPRGGWIQAPIKKTMAKPYRPLFAANLALPTARQRRERQALVIADVSSSVVDSELRNSAGERLSGAAIMRALIMKIARQPIENVTLVKSTAGIQEVVTLSGAGRVEAAQALPLGGGGGTCFISTLREVLREIKGRFDSVCYVTDGDANPPTKALLAEVSAAYGAELVWVVFENASTPHDLYLQGRVTLLER